MARPTIVERCLDIEDALKRLGDAGTAGEMTAVRVRLESSLKYVSAQPRLPEQPELNALFEQARALMLGTGAV